LEENETGNKFDDILHVFGRTSTGASRKYYYRRFEHGYWTAWEKINADIEDNPILPVVWKNRLFLFWLNIVSKGSEDAPLPSDVDAVSLKTSDLNNAGKISVEINLCWSEYYNNKWQPRKTSDFKNPIVLRSKGPFAIHIGRFGFDRNKIAISSRFHSDGSLEIPIINNDHHTTYTISNVGFFHDAERHQDSFILNDTKSALKHDPLSYFVSCPTRTVNSTAPPYGNRLYVDYVLSFSPFRIRVDPVLNIGNLLSFDRVTPALQYHTNVVEVPFFIQDEKYVFLVKPEESLVTVPNYDYVFTDTGIFAHDVTIEQIEIPEIWDKPAIVKHLPRSIDALLVSRTMIDSRLEIDSRSEDLKPIDFWNRDNPLNKVILDNKPIFYGDEAIGPIGSKHARLLYSNKIDTDGEFETVNTKEETQ
jgi:hypothetical protein